MSCRFHQEVAGCTPVCPHRSSSEPIQLIHLNLSHSPCTPCQLTDGWVAPVGGSKSETTWEEREEWMVKGYSSHHGQERQKEWRTQGSEDVGRSAHGGWGCLGCYRSKISAVIVFDHVHHGAPDFSTLATSSSPPIQQDGLSIVHGAVLFTSEWCVCCNNWCRFHKCSKLRMSLFSAVSAMVLWLEMVAW